MLDLPPLGDPPGDDPAVGGALTLGQRWRRLLEDPDEAARVFPSLAGAMAQPTERRRLLKLMAASLALAGCDPATPQTQWVPAVVAAPGIVPGIANRYATATLAAGAALGLVVEHRMGRPVKVEGNPLHPASLGATDAVAQALILDFYDPDRASGLLRDGRPGTPGQLAAALLPVRERLVASHGAGLRVLTPPCASPTVGRALDALLHRLPEARWHQWEACGRDAARAGAQLAYGQPVAVLPRLTEADVLLGFESDLIEAAPGWVRHARDFAGRRNPARTSPGRAPMSRVYAVESVPGLLGMAADHRFATTPAELLAGLRALASGLLGGGDMPGDAPGWVGAVRDDLRVAGRRAFVHAGPNLPAEAHALVHAVNEALGGRGSSYDLIPSWEHRPPEDGDASLRALTEDMHAGRVQALLILDANPVHAAPGFSEALKRVPVSVHAAPAPDETALAASWHVPLAHPFETWGDLRAHDGTAAIQQPQALPLHGGRSVPDLLGLLLDSRPGADARDAVRATWSEALASEDAWEAALADGVVPGTAHAPLLGVRLRPEAVAAELPAAAAGVPTLLFRADPYFGDGKGANNPWLQELPRPLTKHTWENPLLVSPALARENGLADGDVVELRSGAARAELPVAVLPGLAPGCAVGVLGWGRKHSGAVGGGVGWDLFPLRAAGGLPTLRRTGQRARLAGTDRGMGGARHAVGGADAILREGTLGAFGADAGFLRGEAPDDSLYRVRFSGPAAWGMVVDLNACIGCNACVTACQAENNVPVVGRDNVLRQREMHWLRIDRYWTGPEEAPQAAFQPMLCQHCEEAPCETVCPVEATVHDQEGLNLQVYNRCVGTRFCSNNCPYKVRRFNFGPYARDERRAEASRNPEVSVRARGVMEKCTFCVQRIAAARIAHDRDGIAETAVTACQAACPTAAFTFGNLNDQESEVSARKRSPLNYVLLPGEQTHPRLTYEARIRNPNPRLAGTEAG